MAFTPNKPENPKDLICYCDTDIDQAAILTYESDDGFFYRDNFEWKEITPEDDWELDFDGLIRVYIDSAFIAVYDEAEKQDLAISIDEVMKYESVGPETE
jgi:hypothetical protein